MPDIVPEILSRRARRGLSFRPIDDAVIGRLLEAATLAPSCFNNQPWRLIAVTEGAQLERLKAALSSGNAWALRSPCIVAAVTSIDLDCKLSDRRDYALFDVGLAVQNLMLQGTREGLTAHPIAGYKPEVVKEALGIPEEQIVVTLVILGYPGDEAALSEKQRVDEHADRKRKPLEEVVMRDRWRAAP
jgi:nitroreductase